MNAFLKAETAETLADTGAVAAFGGDTYRVVECHVGDEPEDGVPIELHTVPGAEMACF